MKLAVSNVAWYNKEIDSFIEFLANSNCDGIELAASMIWDEPVYSSKRDRIELKRKIEDYGLEVTGLQALLFTHPEFILFGDENTRSLMLDYLSSLISLCYDIGGDVLVFGSPRNRNYNIPYEKAHSIAVDFFSKIGTIAKENNVFFCIEPLSKKETNFINTVLQAEEFIHEAGDTEGLGLHIDIKGLIEENEVEKPYLINSFNKAKHVHVNDPGLKAPGATGFDHSIISDIIEKSKYSHYISIEMRRVEEDVERSIGKAIEYVKNTYLGVRT